MAIEVESKKELGSEVSTMVLAWDGNESLPRRQDTEPMK